MACVPSGLVNIVDFQGNVLDNSFANALPPSANNPVIISNLNPVASLNQEWLFNPVGGVGNGTFAIANGVSSGVALLSFCGATTPSQLKRFSQLVTQLTPSQAVVFRIECSTTVANAAHPGCGIFGHALTSWATVNNGFAPLTYEVFARIPEQTWTIKKV
ncbi:hypothetical protein B0H13DRAFT_1869768 [Mycena leptocephala]|nr:hypothetical protein B0H13DRAFT_1869768 [Mycena leptocephala]